MKQLLGSSRSTLAGLGLLVCYASVVIWPKQPSAESWQVTDSQGRVRLRTAEDADGTFRLVMLDQDGVEVIALGCDSSGAPKVQVKRGSEAIRLGLLPGGEEGDWGIEAQADGKTRTVVNNAGVAVVGADGTRRAWLQAESSEKVECGVNAAGARSVQLMSKPSESGVLIGQNEVGLMAKDGTQVLWLGEMPVSSKPLDEFSGAYLIHVGGFTSQMRLQQSKVTPHVFLQDSLEGGGGVAIGRKGATDQVRAALGKDGKPYIRILRANGDVAWEGVPAITEEVRAK